VIGCSIPVCLLSVTQYSAEQHLVDWSAIPLQLQGAKPFLKIARTDKQAPRCEVMAHHAGTQLADAMVSPPGFEGAEQRGGEASATECTFH
jgi:hypothetical protein